MWLRYPAISPDGQSILFEYKGDIWSVPAGGGSAIPLTMSESYEFSPVWSHDGRSVAFSSDRYGNFDVFVMPANGGEAKRVTFNSAREVPSTFTADDRAILFNGNRQDLATHVQFPAGGMAELYSVPVTGGRVSLVLTTPAFDATVDSKGEKIIFHDYKGYESDWRKHHNSAVTRDVWVYDTKAKNYTQLSGFKGEDRNPVFDSNDSDFYFLSEQSGSFNVYKSSLSRPERSTAVTKFTKHPVRFLTRSKSGTLAFSYDGELYTMKPGGEPSKVNVRVSADGRGSIERIVPVNGGLPRRNSRRMARSSHSDFAARSSSRASMARSSNASPTHRGKSAASALAPTAVRSFMPPNATTTGAFTLSRSLANKSHTFSPLPS